MTSTMYQTLNDLQRELLELDARVRDVADKLIELFGEGDGADPDTADNLDLVVRLAQRSIPEGLRDFTEFPLRDALRDAVEALCGLGDDGTIRNAIRVVDAALDSVDDEEGT
jgi:hypothetical protein